MKILTNKKIIIISVCSCLAFLASAQNTIITNKNLTIEVNNQLQTKINSTFSNAQALTNNFSSSEYLETKYFIAKLFHQIKKEKKQIHEAAGEGTEYKFYGMNDSNKIEKTLSIKIYNIFLMQLTSMYNTLIMVKKICL